MNVNPERQINAEDVAYGKGTVKSHLDANGLMYAVVSGTGTGAWENKDIPVYRGNISDYKWIVLSQKQSTVGVRNPVMIPVDWFKGVTVSGSNYFQNVDTNAGHEIDVYYVSETRIKLFCTSGKDYAVYLMK